MTRISIRRVAGAMLATLALATTAIIALMALSGQNMAVLRHEADELFHDIKDLAGINYVSPIDWREQPDEVVAWIEIPGTHIDYPVVQAPQDDPNYYLSHDQYGNYDIYGVPFITAECESGIESPNVIICAHHMDDGSMFADVASYSNAEFAQGHRRICLYTRDKTLELDVKCAQIINGSTEPATTEFLDAHEYEDWVHGIDSSSCMTLAALDPSKQTFTLCTCSYTTYYDERTLVFCQ